MKEQILSGELTLPVSVNIAFRLTKAEVFQACLRPAWCGWNGKLF